MHTYINLTLHNRYIIIFNILHKIYKFHSNNKALLKLLSLLYIVIEKKRKKDTERYKDRRLIA